MGLDDFKKNVARAAQLLAAHEDGDQRPRWLREESIAGLAEARFETLPADVGFRLGSAAARFRRIAREVAEAEEIAEPEQCLEAAAALRTIAEIVQSLPAT